jgi:hypothetical protein
VPFEWPLQKVLDVAATREKAIKAELFDLSSRIVAQQHELHTREEGLRRMMRELAAADLLARRQRQDMMMKWFDHETRALRRIRGGIETLMAERARKVDELARTRNKKDRLGDLRRDARGEYERQVERREQAQLDEIFHVNFARRAMSAAVAHSA